MLFISIFTLPDVHYMLNVTTVSKLGSHLARQLVLVTLRLQGAKIYLSCVSVMVARNTCV